MCVQVHTCNILFCCTKEYYVLHTYIHDIHVCHVVSTVVHITYIDLAHTHVM